MRQWPRYPDCTPEQRRALWALDARERRNDRRWRERIVLTDPALLAETVTSDRTTVLRLELDHTPSGEDPSDDPSA